MPQTIAYRLTIFNTTAFGESTTVLTPAAGAPHADPFRVATISGVSGYLPYMKMPRGERGAFNLKSSTSTVGAYEVTILDKRTGTDNTNRWVNAFIGNATGTLSILGRKAFIEESLDNGSTWTPFFVGRVSNLDLSSLVEISFTISDSLELMKEDIFAVVPRVPYAVFKSLWPLGVVRDVIADNGVVQMKGAQGFAVGAKRGTGNFRILTLTSNAIASPDNRWAYGNSYTSGPGATSFQETRGQEPFRALVRKSDGTELHYRVNQLESRSKTSDSTSQIRELWLYELSSGTGTAIRDLNYSPIAAMDTGILTSIIVYTYSTNDKKTSPFFLYQEPYTLLADICEGKFFQSGSLTLAVPFVSSSLVALNATQTLPKLFYRIKEKTEAAGFIEKHICKPYGLGFTAEPSASAGIPKSFIRFFSTQLPTSLAGLTTITTADIITTGNRHWESDQPLLAVEGTFYMETRRNTPAAPSDVAWEPTLESSYVVLEGLGGTTVDASYSTEAIDFNGLRGIDDRISVNGQVPTVNNVPSYQYVLGKAREFSQNYFRRNQHGNPSVRLATIRNTKTNSIRVGDFILLSIDTLPNQATRTRGGTRVMQVLSKTPNGIENQFDLVDAGINATMLTPSLGTVTSPSVNTVSFNVTTTENAAIEIMYAVVPAGTAVPNNGSALWMLDRVMTVNNTVQSVTLSGIPDGRRVYVRVRAIPPVSNGAQLPSVYAVSSGLDLANIAAVTGVGMSSINSRAATVSWTNTNTLYTVEVWLTAPAALPDTLVAQLPAASTSFRLLGLNLSTSTSHRVGIRYVDSTGGFSPFTTADFTATGAAPTLDAPAALVLYSGN